jgi:hypothetical protein
MSSNQWVSSRRTGMILSVGSRRVERVVGDRVRSRVLPFGEHRQQRQFWLPDVQDFIKDQPQPPVQ